MLKRKDKQSLGKAGEDYACQMLTKAGLQIVRRNYRNPKGEMDIIARDGSQLVFIEVRTRSSNLRGWGEESITEQKRVRLNKVASYYLIEQGYLEWPSIRFDLIALRWQDGKLEGNWIQNI